MPVVYFTEDGANVPDSRRLTAVVIDPGTEWDEAGKPASASANGRGSAVTRLAKGSQRR